MRAKVASPASAAPSALASGTIALAAIAAPSPTIDATSRRVTIFGIAFLVEVGNSGQFHSKATPSAEAQAPGDGEKDLPGCWAGRSRRTPACFPGLLAPNRDREIGG